MNKVTWNWDASVLQKKHSGKYRQKQNGRKYLQLTEDEYPGALGMSSLKIVIGHLISKGNGKERNIHWDILVMKQLVSIDYIISQLNSRNVKILPLTTETDKMPTVCQVFILGIDNTAINF